MSSERYAIIGSPPNFWLHSTRHGFDLTHPPTTQSPPTYPRIPLQTTTSQVTVDPKKTALVIIDMQNFFLSPNLGRPKDSKGLKACSQLLKYAIPACREADIQIIWLNWGLTQQEIDKMPPATLRAFGFETVSADTPHDDASKKKQPAVDDHGVNQGAEEIAKHYSQKAPFGKDPRLYRGLGSNIGPVELDDRSMTEGGRLLMRDQWNAALYDPLEKTRQEGTSGSHQRQDLYVHKNRMSGLWGGETACTQVLQSRGIWTLLFAGVNTDQCVGGSLQDAFTKGYDCLLLSDGCGTTSPEHSQQSIEFNCAKTWGFVLSCEDLAEGVQNMQVTSPSPMTE